MSSLILFTCYLKMFYFKAEIHAKKRLKFVKNKKIYIKLSFISCIYYYHYRKHRHLKLIIIKFWDKQKMLTRKE